jgi:hypothetical protein
MSLLKNEARDFARRHKVGDRKLPDKLLARDSAKGISVPSCTSANQLRLSLFPTMSSLANVVFPSDLPPPLPGRSTRPQIHFRNC